MSYENSMPATLRAIAADLDQMVDGGIDMGELPKSAEALETLQERLAKLWERSRHEIIRERWVSVTGCVQFVRALIESERADGPSIALLSSVIEGMAGEMSNETAALIAVSGNVTKFRRPGGSAA